MERIFHSFLLIHLFFSVIPECAAASKVISSVPVHVTSEMDWWFAQEYCRTHHSDLITIRDENESKQFTEYKGWIGLHRLDSDGVWKWSRGDENASNIMWANDTELQTRPNTLFFAVRSVRCIHCGNNGFKHWFYPRLRCSHPSADTEHLLDCAVCQGEPHSGDDCVYKYTAQIRLKSHNCSHLHSVLCTEERLILVQEMKTWEEACEHCEELSAEGSMRKYTLANFSQSQWSNRMKIRESATTNEVWIGLRFLADKWFWLNGKPVLISYLPNCPAPMQHCGAMDTNDRKVKIMDCSEKRNFLCYMKP